MWYYAQKELQFHKLNVGAIRASSASGSYRKQAFVATDHTVRIFTELNKEWYYHRVTNVFQTVFSVKVYNEA